VKKNMLETSPLDPLLTYRRTARMRDRLCPLLTLDLTGGCVKKKKKNSNKGVAQVLVWGRAGKHWAHSLLRQLAEWVREEPGARKVQKERRKSH